tara:strand:+ start:115 stop:504 length:390 start_codon:yes stop_codon:yes gene_type:complete
MDFEKTNILSVCERMNMSLDEIEIFNLKCELDKLKRSLSERELENDNLFMQTKSLKCELEEKSEIMIMHDWVIHIDSSGKEYVRGYKKNKYDRVWETSFIQHKISMSTYLLVITESETLYCLPYSESYK